MGRFLVSMRNTWAAYMVDIDTGRIEWTLGGKHSSFEFGPGAAFQWQHDVRLQGGREPSSTVTPVRRSLLPADRRRHLRLTDGTVPRARAHTRPAARTRRRSWPSTAATAASTPTTWATRSRCRTATCSSAGDRNRTSPSTATPASCCSKRNCPGPDLSYRATLEPWVGLPLTPPAGAARTTGGKTTVYASWNGATEVVSWRVLAAAGAGRLTARGERPRSGFETAIGVPQGYSSFEVQALDAGGRVIGTYPALRAGR